MGNPIFRFTLSHEFAGVKVISEPDGWKDTVLKLERHQEFHSLIEYFTGKFTFYGSNGVDDGGINFIRHVEQTYGFDSTITILIEASVNSGNTYQTIYDGQLDLESIEEFSNNKLQCAIIRTDLWSKFISRLDTPVDINSALDLDRNAVSAVDPIELHLSSQKVSYSYRGHLKNNFRYTGLSEGEYGVLDFDVEELSEIKEVYHYELGLSSTEVPFPKFIVEYDGEYVIDCAITISDYIEGSGTVGFLTGIGIWEVYLQINDYGVIVFDSVDIPVPDQTVTLNGIYGTKDIISVDAIESVVSKFFTNTTVNLKKNDSIRVYIKRLTGTSVSNGLALYGSNGDGKYGENSIFGGVFRGFHNASSGLFPTDAPVVGNIWEVTTPGTIGGTYAESGWLLRVIASTPGQDPAKWDIAPLGSSENLFALGQTYLNVTASTSYVGTDAEGVLLHDAGYQITERITGQPDSFYSEYLGSTLTNTRTYDEDGCGWRYALLKGLQIRSYTLTQKPFFQSFNQWWKGINPILNLSLCYDIVDSTNVIRVEDKADHFNTTRILNIDFVKNIQRSYDTEFIFNKIKIGYEKWQSEDISGIDDPQTTHTYSTRFETSGTSITLSSEFIAASLAIEVTRRQTIEKSKDYKYDNETFIIAINPDDTSPDAYVPELNENFDSISNLLHPETRYNIRLTPLRNFLRWINVFSGCLQSYTDSDFYFASGEGNFDMFSKLSADACESYFDNYQEKSDLPISNDFLFLPILYEIEINLSLEDYLTIKNNPRNAIGISQTSTGHQPFFIKSLEYSICKSKCKIKAWPKTYFAITQTDFVAPTVICPTADTDLYRITEEEEIRITEDGHIRIVES